MRRWVGACALVVAATGCEGPVCGPGTIERNGTCEPGNSSDGANGLCGQFTHFDPASQRCEVDYPPTVCDPTTDAVMSVDGPTVCVSGGSPCPIGCSRPSPGYASVCGSLYDVETSESVADFDVGSCDPSAPTATGPCSIGLRFYDALDLAQDPSTAQPLVPGGFRLLGCGSFAAQDLPAPPSGFLAVIADDAGTADVYVQSGTVLPAISGSRLAFKSLYVVRRTTDAMWTQSGRRPVRRSDLRGCRRLPARSTAQRLARCPGSRFPATGRSTTSRTPIRSAALPSPRA